MALSLALSPANYTQVGSFHRTTCATASAHGRHVQQIHCFGQWVITGIWNVEECQSDITDMLSAFSTQPAQAKLATVGRLTIPPHPIKSSPRVTEALNSPSV